MYLTKIYQCIILVAIYETCQARDPIMNAKRIFWSSNGSNYELSVNVSLMVELIGNPGSASPYENFTIVSDDYGSTRGVLSFKKEQVEILYLYNQQIQFVFKIDRDSSNRDVPLIYRETIFNLELENKSQTNTFYRLFTPLNQISGFDPRITGINYVKHIWMSENTVKWIVPGVDAVINLRVTGYHETFVYIIKSRQFSNGCQIPILIFRSKTFSVSSAINNKVVLKTTDNGHNYPDFFFILAFQTDIEASLFVDNIHRDTINPNQRVNLPDEFEPLFLIP